MIPLKEVTYVEKIPRSTFLVLAGDIGGTNSNFGVCSIEHGDITLLLSVHTKSKEITDFPSVVDHVLQFLKTNHNIEIKNACFAAAGVVSPERDYSKPTNLDFIIDTKRILELTPLDSAVIINDFEAVGYGIDRISKKDLIVVNEGKQREHASRAIIGSGTGLGKGILGWNYSFNGYLPIPSEGGHADFPVHSQEEFNLITFMQQEINDAYPVSWEDVLSGSGIRHIYNYLGINGSYQETEYTKEIAEGGTNPDQIFKYWQEDKRCEDTYKLYSRFYARCAKNFALETLSLDGLYIAGGIAAKNLPLFQLPEFMAEFTQSLKQKKLLQSIPVSIVADYNVSLFGAAAFLALGKK